MTKEQLIKIEALLIGLSGYYGIQLEDDVLTMYSEDLADLDFESVVNAFRAIRRDPKIHKHNLLPIPAKILAIVSPQVSPIDDARDGAARVIEAMGRFGRNNPDGAREYMGELAWQAVKMQGGWTALCESQRSENGIIMAHTRDLIVSLISRAKAGVLHLAPSFPPGHRTLELAERHGEQDFENLKRLQLLKAKTLED